MCMGEGVGRITANGWSSDNEYFLIRQDPQVSFECRAVRAHPVQEQLKAIISGASARSPFPHMLSGH